jgi:hypothetical protein
MDFSSKEMGSTVMLKSDDFSNERRASLVVQVNNWIGDMIKNNQLPSGGSYELGEQFLMVSLNRPESDAVESLDKDLGELVTLTGRRHHQLKYNKKALAYARSLVDDDDSLCQLFATKLASNVQDAISWLDSLENQTPEFATGTWRVRLVTIPTYHAHAFLIEKMKDGTDMLAGESYVLMISAPPWLEKLQGMKLLTPTEFLLGFQDKKPIIGLHARTSRT